MMKFKIRILLLFLLFSPIINSQIKKIGVPFIVNYSPKAYKAASENWDVLQDSKGMMFFANHFGIMQFDGVRWAIVTQPENRSMVRSMTIDKNDKMYVGAQGDFGFVIQLPNGQYQYTSLVKLLPKSARNFGDVLHTVIRNNEVIFFSYERIFIYKNKAIKVIDAKTAFDDFFEVGGEIYVSDNGKGLLKLKDGALISVENGEKFVGMQVRKIFQTKDGFLLFTQKNGLFTFNENQIKPFVTEVDHLLKQNQISAGIELSDGYFGIGTRQSGLIVIDSDGHLVQHIDKQMGLQNEYVTNFKIDKEGNLWVTLKGGISLIQISSPLSKIIDGTNSETKIYCSQIYQNKLYIGTDNGLFWLNWEAYKSGKRENITFQHVSGMSENVWNLGVFGNSLLAFEKNGIFEINGDSAKSLAQIDGAWQGILIPNRSDLLVVGGYTGLYLLKKVNGSWVFQHRIKGFEESSRIMETDKQGNIWIAHGYKGIYKLKFNSTFDSVTDIQFYNDKNGLIDCFGGVQDIKNKIDLLTEKGMIEENAGNSSLKLIIEPAITLSANTFEKEELKEFDVLKDKTEELLFASLDKK